MPRPRAPKKSVDYEFRVERDDETRQHFVTTLKN
jgi:hypothetical protein